MSDLRAALGAAIRVARARQNVSAAEIARRAGMDAAHLSDIERGRRDPGATTVERIARALNMTASELLAAAEQERARRRPDDRP